MPEGLFDALCIGAAEGTWPDILRDLQQGQLRPVYRCSPTFTGRDIIPPAYDLIPADKYLYTNIMHTSRGCPFKCDFCYNSFGGHRYIHREIDDVVHEIQIIGRKHIMFIDDNFIGDPAWTRKLLEAIKPMNIKWNAAGCQGLFIGFESINAASVGSVHKVQNDRARYEQAIDEIHRRGIMINASFVFGLDEDTPDVFKQTLDWIVAQRIETVTSHILTPYPGTKLYEKLNVEGRLTSTDLSLYNTAHVVFRPKGMTAQQLRDGYLWIYRELYSWKNIWRRMPRSPRQRLAYLTFNIFYRKYGRLTDRLCRLFSYRRIGIIAERLARYL